MDLYALFSQCLKVRYTKVGISANYAFKREGETLRIYFEDSDGAHDWKRNLDFPAKPYKRMQKTVWFAHRGFLKEWKEIEPSLANEIADTSVKKVIIAGYSHGAAIAVLCHEYVWYRRPDLRKTLQGYGFGCPRVFWGIRTPDLQRRWENFLVIRNLDDLVTHLPPAFLGYSHVGKLCKIGKRGKYSSIQAHYSANILQELASYEKP